MIYFSLQIKSIWNWFSMCLWMHWPGEVPCHPQTQRLITYLFRYCFVNVAKHIYSGKHWIACFIHIIRPEFGFHCAGGRLVLIRFHVECSWNTFPTTVFEIIVIWSEVWQVFSVCRDNMICFSYSDPTMAEKRKRPPGEHLVTQVPPRRVLEGKNIPW